MNTTLKSSWIENDMVSPDADCEEMEAENAIFLLVLKENPPKVRVRWWVAVL